jgi:hypothetical protein
MDGFGCSGYLKVLSAKHPAHQAGIRRKSRKYHAALKIPALNSRFSLKLSKGSAAQQRIDPFSNRSG